MLVMEKPTPSHLSMQARISPMRTIQAPQGHEGIGNALRAAFDPGSYGLPDDLARLLSKLDRK
ncbi:hypothetical protein Swit_3923 [Rhizorhabdus wittichii RW1]|uniref:Anti-sigma factor NepR domain-containing protein n=2 Tax=Rhizorhabdus wittichii TaxID=160791 RepID=A0A9J9HEM9_RHIWR|nr:hypothetical protein Swit_3923 [Rhizorhabdus wittichii RW1]